MKEQKHVIKQEEKEIELFIERLAEVLIEHVKGIELQANSNKDSEGCL